MYYESTRNRNIKKNFSEVLLKGLAEDGGLYIPKKWVKFSNKDFKKFERMTYHEMAFHISKRFIGKEIKDTDLKRIITKSLKNFSNKDIATLKNLSDNEWLLELYHGPTLAFKDYALQIVGNLFDYILKKTNKKITIIGATSGDTGSAAIDGCKKKKILWKYLFFIL